MDKSQQKLIDYFVICGLNNSTGLESDQLAGDNLHCSPLSRPYKSYILGHYPDAAPGYPFDAEAVCMLCFPRGLSFCTQNGPRKSAFHSFMITKEDGTRAYGAALKFYEEIDNIQICGAMQTLQAMHMAELSNTQSRTLYSHLGPVYGRSPISERKSDLASSGLVYDEKKDVLYCTKCICVISRLPLVWSFSKLLQSLHDLVMAEETTTSLPLASYIYNMIHEVSMPGPGQSMRLITCKGSIVCQRPGNYELPLLDYPLREVFVLFNVREVLTIFCSVLLEHQILFFSKDFGRLMLVSEGITSLIFPFQWQHVYVPILPASLLHFLDAPVPFIMGLQTDDGKSVLENCSKHNMCVVDIDNGIVDIPDDLPKFPYFDQLAQDIEQEIRRQTSNDDKNGHQRDSGIARHSFFSSDSDTTSTESSSSSVWSLTAKMEMLQQNEAMAKMTALAKKSGIISSLDDIRDSLTDAAIHASKSGLSASRALLDDHVKDLIFNSSVREIFLHYFLHIFGSYESFVVQTAQDMESWVNNREMMQNFDKTAFLSDQADNNLQFLSPFTETQMFTSFIDNKILAQWEEPDMNLIVFETRLKAFRDDQSDQRLRRFYRTAAAKEAESIIEKRATIVDIVSPSPKPMDDSSCGQQTRRNIFPVLPSAIFNKDPSSNKTKSMHDKWRAKYGITARVVDQKSTFKQRDEYIQEVRSKAPRQPNLADMNLKAMVNNNWKFMEALLKECKTKTKRMLVQKMGQEAVDLGHGEVTVVGVEENTLIASLCDFLERIWTHGLSQKQGKSALWSHLIGYNEADNKNQDNSGVDSSHLTPDLSAGVATEVNAGNQCPSGTQTWPVRHHRRKPSRGPELPALEPLPVSVLYDLRNVLQMSEIKTAVGYSRAFVRLSLEKKLLSKHLKELLSNQELLRSLYKRYAFLRCEDEREQFLYHLLSLNAVDYFCFTNSFTTTNVMYRVLIFPRLKLSGGATSANCWLSLAGQLGETEKLPLPKHTLDVSIKHRNLGILTTMRIGHDNSGISPKWLVEHVLVRNEITGHTYRFPCGRWLGKGSDDGALERLLVAEPVPPTVDANELMEKCRTPPRCRSPSMPRRSNEPRLQIPEIQEKLSDAVNNLVKHFCKPEKERGSATGLLCGEYGLVYCMEHIFQYGFKSSRLFRNRFFIWDFLEKVLSYLETLLSDTEHYQIAAEISTTMQSFCYVVSCINQASESIGKDGRFQIFICIGVRDRLLQRWIKLISKTPVTSSMYEELSFLRDPPLVQFVLEILDSLKEFRITLEASLIKGVNL